MMKTKYKDHTWSDQKPSKECETYQCPVYDNYNSFKRDPTGYYVLIRVNFGESQIEVAVCNPQHKIVRIFRGRKSQDIYDAIFNYENEHNVLWFKEKTHIAYLGKELKKAEWSLVSGGSYFQE